MFGIGTTELLVILVVALIVLGPSKLPTIARTLGKALGEFKRVSNDFTRTIEADVERQDFQKRKQEAEKDLFGDKEADAKAGSADAKAEDAKADAKTVDAEPAAEKAVDDLKASEDDVDDVQAMAEVDAEPAPAKEGGKA